MEKSYALETIVSERITLKRHHADLAQQMFDYVVEDRERLSEFLPWPKFINTVEDELAFIKRCDEAWENYEGSQYGIYRNSDNEYMGNVSAFKYDWTNLHFEIGYWILGKFEGQGYMTESVTALQNHLFDRGFHRSVIRCDTQNVRSSSIPKKLNYTFEGTAREIIVIDQEFRHLEIYSKLSSD